MKIDPALIQKCSKGDRRAQHDLYKACFSPLMGICMRYKNNQEDGIAILNDAFLKILHNLPELKPHVPFEPWAKRITINCCINEYRKNKRNPEFLLFDPNVPMDYYLPLYQHGDNEVAVPRISMESLRALLDKLPNSSQEVFQLYVLEGYNHMEIGSILGISEGTSKWHLNNARKILKALLKEKYNIVRSNAS
ncbi:MAG: sigma-70 family RNA polymerase sigma factor [Flavobacteriales bacterium]|nr:sigma-70 family RNA polymerase sigma factor [Flavobacteriales bacterium]